MTINPLEQLRHRGLDDSIPSNHFRGLDDSDQLTTVEDFMIVHIANRRRGLDGSPLAGHR